MTCVGHVKATSALANGMTKRMRKRELNFSERLISGLITGLGSRTANACYKDAADLHAELEDFPQAIARYEQVADHSLTSNLTRYSVKEYWLRASLCALAMGVWPSFLLLILV
jgi:hypothetical protein